MFLASPARFWCDDYRFDILIDSLLGFLGLNGSDRHRGNRLRCIRLRAFFCNEAWADADGTPLTQTDLDAVNKQADGLTGFMALLRGLGSDAQSYLC
jgi:hypothetical protein